METCDNGCEHGYIKKQDNKIIGTSRVYDRKVLIVVYRVRELTASAKVALANFPNSPGQLRTNCTLPLLAATLPHRWKSLSHANTQNKPA